MAGAVTKNDDIIEVGGIILKGDVEVAFGAHFGGLEAHIAHHEGAVGFCIDCELAVGVGGNTYGASLYKYAGTDKRLAVAVSHRTLNSLALLLLSCWRCCSLKSYRTAQQTHTAQDFRAYAQKNAFFH